jgi:threonine dehydrogenase-like Zn-dependent dehydrogenase
MARATCVSRNATHLRSSHRVCGSDLWPYRGIQATPEPTPMGHEYCGIVEVSRKRHFDDG